MYLGMDVDYGEGGEGAEEGVGEGEGEGEEGEEGGDPEDKEIYCFCQKLSYGEVRLRHLVILSYPTLSNSFCQWLSG